MADDEARVEGRIALRIRGIEDAGLAATVVTSLLSDCGGTVLTDAESIEVVSVDLVQVQVAASD